MLGILDIRSVLNNFGLKNHVNKATDNLGHTLDLIIDCFENSLVGSVYVGLQYTISDHMVVNFRTQLSKRDAIIISGPEIPTVTTEVKPQEN